MASQVAVPFVLRDRRRLPPDAGPSHQHTYDDRLQLWIDNESGLPAVLCTQGQEQQSNFGETTLTETREGADQTEISDLQASRFGETTMSKTMEGTDQAENPLGLGTQFGETTLTATAEGADQSESVDLDASSFGETTLTCTVEGVDQLEGADVFESDTFLETATVPLDTSYP